MFNTDLISDIFSAAKEVFCDGIYVKSNTHPCGWDFVSFEFLEVVDDMFNEPIGTEDISNGCYAYHDYEGKTVVEILDIVGENGYCFEISGVDNLK